MGQRRSSKGASRGSNGVYEPDRKNSVDDGGDYEFDLKDGEYDSEDNFSEDSAADEDDDDMGCRPDTVDRQCTDPWCLFVFAAALAANAYVVRYALAHGNLQHFRAFVDLRGEYCIGNTSDRYLYFCENHPGKLNTTHPVCVSSCPNDTLVNHSFACESYGFFANTTDYPTEPHFGMMCRPMPSKLKAQVAQYTIQTRHSFVKRVATDHFEAIVALFFITVIASYIYLEFLGRCAHVVVWSGLVIAMLVPLGAGMHLMGWLTWVGLVPRPYEIAPNLDANPIIGAILLFIGSSFACCGMQMSASVDEAMQCLEDSIYIVMSTPVLQWQPVIDLTFNIASNAMTVVGFVWILSCQDISLVFGHHSSFVNILLLTKEQCAYLAVLIFVFFWIQQTNYMMSKFVITFITQIYYFNGGDEGEGVPTRALGQAYWAVSRYHLGSMAKGALTVGLTRPLRLLLGILVGFTDLKANAVGIMVNAVCCLCFRMYRECLEQINADALIEVALNATPFTKAALTHKAVIDKEVDTKRILHGATRVFQWAGMVLIGVIGAVAICTLRESMGGYEVTSPRQHMLARLTFLCVGVVISVSVCFPFMMLFDTIADTILYIRTVEKLRSVRRQKWSWPQDILSCVCCARQGVTPINPELAEYLDTPTVAAINGNRSTGLARRPQGPRR